MKLGKLPARHDARTLKYANYQTGSADAPWHGAHWGHGLTYDMDGNDQYGDCVEAAHAHQVQVWTDRAGNAFIPREQDVLDAYAAITGFNPDDPSTDQGTDMLSAVKYWKSAGMAGHKIDAYASVSPAIVRHVKEAVAFYGGLTIGLALPVSAQNQVGDIWEVTTGPDAQAGSWGGHCVPVVGYTADGLWAVTWGAMQLMTWGFLATYCDEAYVLLSQDWMAASGTSPSALAWGLLQADLANL